MPLPDVMQRADDAALQQRDEAFRGVAETSPRTNSPPL
jgi:hypothetical protein